MIEVFYFAYGSNLDTVQMKKRVGGWIALERAIAEGYKLVFNVSSPPDKWDGWTANIKKTDTPSNVVYGVVYIITDEQLKTLTGCESREPTSISVRLESGFERNNVKVYIWPKEDRSHKPPKDYQDAIIRGLKQHGYTQDVIDKVQMEFCPDP